MCSSNTYDKDGRTVGASQHSGQRDWQSKEPHCKAGTLQVQVMTHASQLPVLQPQAGEKLIASFCIHLRYFMCCIGSDMQFQPLC